MTKLETFADEKLNVAKMTNSLFDRVESMGARKGENAGYQHFLSFSRSVFQSLHLLDR